MGSRDGGRSCYETKECPRCGAELYADLQICYGCLYDFSRDVTHAAPVLPDADPHRDEGGEDTYDLGAAASILARATGPVGMLVRTSVADLWVSVPEEGLLLGRDPSCDVVLHSPAVSRRHLRVVPTPNGMDVCDLGSTNPATYRGREVSDRVAVAYGESVDVCGCLLTMTGPATGPLEG